MDFGQNSAWSLREEESTPTSFHLVLLYAPQELVSETVELDNVLVAISPLRRLVFYPGKAGSVRFPLFAPCAKMATKDTNNER